MISSQIKNIVFDLGGVLLNIDHSLTIKAFKDLNILDFEKVYSQATQKDLFDRYEKGLITSSEFRKGIKNWAKKDIKDNEIDIAWNAMLLDFPKERIQLLEKLKSNYPLFLLSNTNEIHITAYSIYMNKTFGFPDLSHIFQREYYSYKQGMRKPDAEIFEKVLVENNLHPSETLFIDDSIQHIEGAKKCGIQTIWLKGGMTVLDIF